MQLFARSDPWGLVMLPRLFVLQQNTLPWRQKKWKTALPRTPWNKRRFEATVLGLVQGVNRSRRESVCWCVGSKYAPTLEVPLSPFPKSSFDSTNASAACVWGGMHPK